jgi:hypothetical protein
MGENAPFTSGEILAHLFSSCGHFFVLSAWILAGEPATESRTYVSGYA